MFMINFYSYSIITYIEKNIFLKLIQSQSTIYYLRIVTEFAMTNN